MEESFADLRRRSRMVNQEKPSRRAGGVAPGGAKSMTVVTTGKAAEREMQAMERRVAAAKPQRKAGGGPVLNPINLAALQASATPMPLKKAGVPMPLKSLDPYAANAYANNSTPANNAKRGGRQTKKRGQ